MENCIFCKIVKREIPSYRVWEDADYLAFFSITPHQEGHTLLIPKRHEDYFFDLEDAEISSIMTRAKPIAKKLKEVFKPKSGKVGLILAGMGVHHVHIHLIPMDSEDDLDFKKAEHNITAEDFEMTLQKIGKID